MSDSVVEQIRERLGEEGLEYTLKTNLGGYTKKSVTDYIAELKKQQDGIIEVFNNDMQALLQEKDKLTNENEELQNELKRIDNEYKVLSETILTYKVEDSEYSLDDVTKLKSTVNALQKKIDDLESNLRLSEQDISHKQSEIEINQDEIKQAKQENKLKHELLLAEKANVNQQREQVAELSRKIIEQRNEIKFLKGITEEGNVAKLNLRIAELSETIAKYEETVDVKNALIETMEEKNLLLFDQNHELSKNMEKLTETVNGLHAQNSKLLSANQMIEDKLREEIEKSMQLYHKISDEVIEKLNISRKLEQLTFLKSAEKIEVQETE